MSEAAKPEAPSDLRTWRALVDKELPGAPFATPEAAEAAFQKALVRPLGGLSLAPLYIDAPVTRVPVAPAHKVALCMPVEASEIDSERALGTDVFWSSFDPALPAQGRYVFDGVEPQSIGAWSAERVLWGLDPASEVLAQRQAQIDLSAAVQLAQALVGKEHQRALTVSTVAYHEAGAEAVDELAFALATSVRYLRALTAAGLTADQAARSIAFRLPVGRDTFGELCKLRALRLCWAKINVAASGSAEPTLIHAVSSTRTQTARDPWVNLLRVSTQMFAAIIGGADLVTPLPFDVALGQTDVATHKQARRIARNTVLVLREESHLGRVVDPTEGAYFFESLTDQLARRAWGAFQELEKSGGIAAQLADPTTLRARFDRSWTERSRLLASRKEPITGVSEFANLDEARPAATPLAPTPSLLPHHRDAEAFEQLRDHADLTSPTVQLVLLGSPAEYRARVGFATALLAVGGLRVTEAKSELVCLCGSDERYATEAVERARALKAAGARHILLAGRPGTLEAQLRAAGVDGFIYLGCDVIAALAPLLEVRA